MVLLRSEWMDPDQSSEEEEEEEEQNRFPESPLNESHENSELENDATVLSDDEDGDTNVIVSSDEDDMVVNVNEEDENVDYNDDDDDENAGNGVMQVDGADTDVEENECNEATKDRFVPNLQHEEKHNDVHELEKQDGRDKNMESVETMLEEEITIEEILILAESEVLVIKPRYFLYRFN